MRNRKMQVLMMKATAEAEGEKAPGFLGLTGKTTWRRVESRQRVRKHWNDEQGEWYAQK